MSTNISKQKRDDLLNKIKQIKAYIESSPQDENTKNLLAYLGELTKEVNGKKYGLVFEEHREAIDEILEKNAPVLTEEEDLFIDNGGEMNFLIEGDNLAALKLLEKTHKGKIDVIYIDPPYNTGNKDFIYDDSFVDSNDEFKHSKWLSFMDKRLRIAKKIISEKGYIFISIDDNEQSQLKLLCDEIFSEMNFISNSFVLDNLKGKTNDNFITSVGSRLLVYAKNKSSVIEEGFQSVENLFGEKIENKYKFEDEVSYYATITFKKTGQSKLREDRPNMFYPILNKEGVLYAIEETEFLRIYDKKNKVFNDSFLQELKDKYKDYEFILPLDSDGKYLRWTSAYNTFCKKKNNEVFYDNGVKQKVRPEPQELLQIYASGTPKSFMYKSQYSIGTDDLKKTIGENDFSFPKPIQLIYDICVLLSSKNITILDFFAGSGTTGHAVMKLNAEDGGHRKFILCTNNENGICRDITYQRLKTVITGKQKDGSDYDEKYNASLKYYKIDYIPIEEKMYYEYADELLEHVRELVELENAIDFNTNQTVAIVLDDEELEDFVNNIDEHKECKILYKGHDVLSSYKQEQILKAHGISVNVVPDYYYRDLAD